MCMFCAGIPTVVTVGMAAVVQQRTAEKTAAAQGQPRPQPRWPAGRLTAAAVIMLGIGSAIVHTHGPL